MIAKRETASRTSLMLKAFTALFKVGAKNRILNRRKIRRTDYKILCGRRAKGKQILAPGEPAIGGSLRGDSPLFASSLELRSSPSIRSGFGVFILRSFQKRSFRMFD